MKKKRIVLILGVVAIFSVILIKQQITIAKLAKQYKQYNEQLSKLKYINSELSEDLKKTEKSEYIEQMAREKFGLIKPGEILFKDKNKIK